jgi:type VI secretion system secreted protein VgrG
VIGQVYNAMAMPPWKLPDNATQIGLLTRSSKGGGYGNANAIRFEDRAGEEELWIHAEKDMLTEVENNSGLHIGNSRAEKVEGNQVTTVGKTYTVEVGDRQEFIVGASSMVLESDGTITIDGINIGIRGASSVTVDGKLIDLN